MRDAGSLVLLGVGTCWNPGAGVGRLLVFLVSQQV